MDIVLGALCPKLSEQIPGLSEHYDRDADAITRLVIRGILTDSEATKARKRLLKRIERDLCSRDHSREHEVPQVNKEK